MDYPRVTEILRPHTSYDNVPGDILKKAAARGTTVHSLCAGIAKDAWIPDSMIGAEYLGYVNSFRKWSEAQVKKYVIVEKRFVNTVLGFTGQLDFVVVGSDDELYLVDLKTSASPQKTYPVQMAAYDLLLRAAHVNVKGAMLVYLDKNGEFPKINLIHDLSEELHVFICALDCWNYFHKKKGKKNERKETVKLESENTCDHGGT